MDSDQGDSDSEDDWNDAEDDLPLSAVGISILQPFVDAVDAIPLNKETVNGFLKSRHRIYAGIQSGKYSDVFNKMSGIIAYKGKASDEMISFMESLVPKCDFQANEVAALLFMYSLTNKRWGYISFAMRLNSIRLREYLMRSEVPITFRYLERFPVSLTNHSVAGMSDPQYIPLVVRMLWDVIENAGCSEDWRVMFYLEMTIDITEKMPDQALKSLRSDYPEIPKNIERIVLVFGVVFDGVPHVMCVLIVRPASGTPFITVLDNLWNDATQVQYRLHYINMLRQIGECIGMAPVRVALPPNFSGGAPGGISDVTKNDQPPWLQDVLENRLISCNFRSKSLQCTYEAYLFIKMAVTDSPFLGDELQYELTMIHNMIDRVNLYLTESILSGCFQLSVVSIYVTLLKLGRLGMSPYYTIDPGPNKPTNVYGLAVSGDGEPVVKALKYGMGTGFHWETVSHTSLGKRQREPEDTLQLDKLLLLFGATSPDMIPPGMRSLMTIDLILNKLSFKLQK